MVSNVARPRRWGHKARTAGTLAEVLLPWGSLFIESSLAPDAAAARLSDRIGAGIDWKPLGSATTVNIDGGREFRFQRRIQYRNSFLPGVRARVEGLESGGSRIRIRMCPRAFALVVWAVWMGVAASS